MILFFSADSFDDAQLIANEAIALFRSRGFELENGVQTKNL